MIMKNIMTFESWKNNIIDYSLFRSGKAKYHPRISGNTITYKTGDVEPYYTAEIKAKGNQFICKIYKVKKNGEKIRIKNKIKEGLKLSHNYVREYLNQKLKKNKYSDQEKSDKNQEKETPILPPEEMMKEFLPTPSTQLPYIPEKPKTIIRHF